MRLAMVSASVVWCAVVCGGGGVRAADEVDFDRDVAPILIARCLECHAGADPKGELDLARHEAVTAKDGLLVTGRPDESELWLRVESDEMPPKKPLEAAEKDVLRKWIATGAKWGTNPVDPFRVTTKSRAGYDWWSLQPVRRPVPPDEKGAAHPIDRFVLHRLRELDPDAALSPEADRRTLIRRVTFDLVGLPPAPEEVAEFVADTRADAYERMVDRLLASPHYGERQARHWLDVVRFGETDGFERNTIRPNAWPYRDWLIRAFNADLPYDEFVRMQIAGDVLYDEGTIADDARRDAIVATGALVAGVHNTVLGNEEMRLAARQDEIEDLLGSVGQTFLGVTLNCARCHDHKFDPVTQADYYAMAASLVAVRHGERSLPRPEVEQRLLASREALAKASRDLDGLERPVREAILKERGGAGELGGAEAVRPVAAWDFRTGMKDLAGTLHCEAKGEARQTTEGVELHGRVEGGTAHLRSAPLGFALGPKTLEAWVRLGNDSQRGGGVMSVQTPDGAVFDAIVYGENEPKRWMAGSNGFVRTSPFRGTDETEAAARVVQIVLTYAADGTITAYRDGQPYGQPYKSAGLQVFEAGHAVVLFGCRHEPAGGNRMWGGTLVAARLYDRPLAADEVIRAHATGPGVVAEEEIVARLDAASRERRKSLQTQTATLQSEIVDLQARAAEKVYATTVGKIEPVHLLARGDLRLPRGEAAPGMIAAVRVPGVDGVPKDAGDRERRRRLAAWIASPANPLAARVIVNRVWHGHFGTGIVDTPNDFGFNGGRPSHPELLDWLAAELVSPSTDASAEPLAEGGAWRLKRMHRLVVTSAAYKRSSRPRAEWLAKDVESRLLWRKPARRLDAEQLRDAMLAVSGLLDRSVGGKGFSDYKDTFLNGTTYFEPFDNEAPEALRRSVYRFLPRGANPGLLDAFDCPDPSASAPRRAVTTTPLQALSLWNNNFTLRCADALAARAEREGEASGAVRRVWMVALQRDPKAEEAKDAEGLARDHGLATLCRALLNSNEFLLVE
jgi:hypothetical protein